jgi:hypothetical protein
MNVDKALDEHELASLRRRETKNLGQSVGRKPGAACSAEVEVARRGIGILKRASPERSDSSMLVAPSATESPGPAAVRENTGLRDLELGVTRGLESVLREKLGRHDAEVDLADELSGKSATLEV